MNNAENINDLETLPEGWVATALSDVCRKGKQWSPQKEFREGFHYVDVSAVSNQTYSINDPVYYEARKAPGRARKVIHKNDVLFATIRPSLRRIAFVDEQYDDQMASTAFCVLRPKKEICTRFIYYSVLTDPFIENVCALQHGASYPAVTDKNVLAQKIILPTGKMEQKKIAAILLKLQKAILIQERTLGTLRELKKAALQRIFTQGLHGKSQSTDLGPIPEGWERATIAGKYVFTKKPREVRYNDYEKIAFVPMEYIPNSEPAISKFDLKAPEELTSGTYFEQGDVLISKITPCFENGKQGIAEEIPNGFGVATTEVIPLKEIAGVSDKYFLFYYLQFPCIRQEIAGKMEGATGRQRVPVSLLQNWQMPFPKTVEEQKQIASIFQTLDKKIGVHERKRDTLNELFRTTLNQLMTAQIRVNNLKIDTSEVETRGDSDGGIK